MSHLYDRAVAFINGMVAGWSQVFVMQPFEIIKVRLQTQSKESPQYKGIVDCLTKIIKNQGPFALYKGTLTPLLGVGIMGSVRFGAYQNFQKSLALGKGTNGVAAPLTIQDKVVAAFGAGIVASTLVCPVEHTRIRIQIQRGSVDKVYSGSVDAAVKIFKQHGIKGLYRGQGPTTIREATGLSFFFFMVETMTKKLTPPGAGKDGVPVPSYVPFISGGVGGMFYWVFNYPFDYVKTLMQSDKFGDYKYPNMLSCFKDQYKAGGVSTFYRGFLICMMRSFPVNAAFITTYRFCQRITNVSVH